MSGHFSNEEIRRKIDRWDRDINNFHSRISELEKHNYPRFQIHELQSYLAHAKYLCDLVKGGNQAAVPYAEEQMDFLLDSIGKIQYGSTGSQFPAAFCAECTSRMQQATDGRWWGC